MSYLKRTESIKFAKHNQNTIKLTVYPYLVISHVISHVGTHYKFDKNMINTNIQLYDGILKKQIIFFGV